jgi:3-deoxy-manno-octulosonate cytidylyltransferase (CMP-KDO synthetase)
MSVVAFITAFVGKSESNVYLQEIDGKAVISHCYETTVATGLFSDVLVLTDNEDVEKKILAAEGKVKRYSRTPDSSVEYVAEAGLDIEADIILHIHGNIPNLKQAPIEKLLKTFEDATSRNIQVASIVYKMQHAEEIADPNRIKATLNMRLFAMYFSRYPVPFLYHKDLPISHYAHTGIYAYRKAVLFNFMNWPVAPLERTEQIESLRFLENGIDVKMLISHQPITQIYSATAAITA